MRRIALLFALALAGCPKERPTTGDAGAPVVDAATAPVALSNDDGRAIVKGACLSCHAEDMLAQQRLTPAQWTKVVAKMVTWGANLEPRDAEPLAAWLAATYGPDAGPWKGPAITTAEAPLEILPLPDGPFASGDPERGRAVYMDRCSSCHGPEGRGQLGVRLVDRPFLYRATDVAETIRRGRGKMAPIALTDSEVADVLAYLRRLGHG